MKYCVRCGGEMADTAVVCPQCGAQTVPPVEDKPDTAMNVISFFIPLVGLILFLVYHDRQPRKAKSAGKFALIGVGLAAAVVLVMGALGKAPMWLAVFADVGVSVIAILNAMRALKTVK